MTSSSSPSFWNWICSLQRQMKWCPVAGRKHHRHVLQRSPVKGITAKLDLARDSNCLLLFWLSLFDFVAVCFCTASWQKMQLLFTLGRRKYKQMHRRLFSSGANRRWLSRGQLSLFTKDLTLFHWPLPELSQLRRSDLFDLHLCKKKIDWKISVCCAFLLF